MFHFLLRNILILYCFSFKTTSSQYNGTPQPNVLSGLKQHALYLWIHLSPKANFTECVHIAANLSSFVEKISPNSSLSDEIIEAGVAFGNNIWSLIFNIFRNKTSKPRLTTQCSEIVTNSSLKFPYYYRKGALGDMPDTGGDIFIHAKCDTQGKLFGLAKLVTSSFPKGSIKCFEDTYSFLYEKNRDLSFFIDGTMNPSGTEEKLKVAVMPNTGGSICITQKWVHNFDKIDHLYNESTLESFIGRTRSTSEELRNKSACSHVARIVGTTDFNAPRTIQIVRQSMPYGTVSRKAGLFFIGFAANVSNIDIMLDRMVGKTLDGISDCVMKISQCIQSAYWYFPSVQQLTQLRKSM